VRKFSVVLANLPFSDEFWWAFYPPLYAVSRGLALWWLTMPGRIGKAPVPLSTGVVHHQMAERTQIQPQAVTHVIFS
jgi:hypothetical protein